MKKLSFCLTLSALCIFPASAYSATTLLSENFNELTPALTVTSVGAFSAIGGTNVDIVGGALFGSLCVSPASGNCVDMDGSNGNSQGILQSNSSFSLSPGTNYFLSFDLLGSSRGNTASTTVTFGPYSQTFVLASDDVTSGVVSNLLITVPTSTVTNLTFTSNTPGNVGNILDNVLITSSASSATPEPSSFVLLGLGLLSFFALTRRLAR